MTQNIRPILTSTGVTVASGVLAPSTSYLFMLGRSPNGELGKALIQGVQILWPVGFIGVFHVEDTVFDDDEVADNSLLTEEWFPVNPLFANVPIIGGTVSRAIITVPGSTRGGCRLDIGNSGAFRTRVRAEVGLTGGTLRFAGYGRGAL